MYQFFGLFLFSFCGPFERAPFCEYKIENTQAKEGLERGIAFALLIGKHIQTKLKRDSNFEFAVLLRVTVTSKTLVRRDMHKSIQ